MHKGVLPWNFTVYDGDPRDFKRLGQGDEHLQSQARKHGADICYVFTEA